MKFASILACFGVVASQTAVAVKEDSSSNADDSVFGEMTCLQLHDHIHHLNQETRYIPWRHNPCNQYPMDANNHPYNATECAHRRAVQTQEDDFYNYFYGPSHRADQCQLKEMGIHVDHTNNNGTITATYNWRAVENYSMHWAQWFEHESQSPEVQEIAEHLNNASRRMIDDVAAGQIAVVRSAGKLVYHFTQWAEPHDSCDAEAFVQCLYGENPFRGNPLDIYEGHCAQQSGCEIHHPTMEQLHTVRNETRRTQRAIGHMAQEVSQSFVQEMRSQAQNAMRVSHHFLEEARERYTAWGCNAQCTREHTRSLGALGGMKWCQCPASITISGDTRVLFN